MFAPDISVIVPVYNTESYLKKCIESIINQTFRNIEIILVDDGSTDTSAEILADYALRDNRIIVIHQENQDFPRQEMPVCEAQKANISCL